MFGTVLDGPHKLTHPIHSGRLIYVYLAKGEASIQGEQLSAGDGISIAEETTVELSDGKGAEVLLFDLPGKKE